jgi:hypothetical protein
VPPVLKVPCVLLQNLLHLHQPLYSNGQSESSLSIVHEHTWATILYRYDKGDFGLSNKNRVKCEFIQPLSLDEALNHTNLKLWLGDEAEHFFGALPDKGKKLSLVLGAIQQTILQ